ncbi:unnamed protein product, partial [Ixodes pacificus]
VQVPRSAFKKHRAYANPLILLGRKAIYSTVRRQPVCEGSVWPRNEPKHALTGISFVCSTKRMPEHASKTTCKQNNVHKRNNEQAEDTSVCVPLTPNLEPIVFQISSLKSLSLYLSCRLS